jgi:hypothetical protein
MLRLFRMETVPVTEIEIGDLLMDALGYPFVVGRIERGTRFDYREADAPDTEHIMFFDVDENSGPSGFLTGSYSTVERVPRSAIRVWA